MSAVSEPLHILVVDDNKAYAETLADIFESADWECTVATSRKAAEAKLEQGVFDVVFTDLNLPAAEDGLAVVDLCREQCPDVEVFVLTGHAGIATAVEAMKRGASHYLEKDHVNKKELVSTARNSAARVRTVRDLRQQLDEKFGFEGVVGNSPRMLRVLQLLKAYAPTVASVLILGENGTGKELAARALHMNSPRKAKPFVAMNCAALNENLLDDEMFGHEDGAFTGARGQRKGRFEFAHGGTLFLDEVGDMPLSLQAKLLRVLDNSEIVRIGSNEAIKVDVRIIAATNRDLDAAVKDGKFRLDLFHRLKVGTVRLPPLRERKEDIPQLGSHFLKESARKHGRTVERIAPAVWKAFETYEWPGNVRELRNLIDSMVVLDADAELTLDDLPEDAGIRPSGLPGASFSSSGADHLIGKPLAEVERYYMEKALELTKGNREDAAAMLGIGERTLYRKIQEWKLGTS